MSDNLTVSCSRCEATLTHECRRWSDRDGDGNTVWREDQQHHPNPLVHAFVELLLWKPEGGLPEHFVEAMKKSDWYDDGDEDRPFFSQSVIYPLLDWKDNARSLFSLVYGWMRAAGFDPHEIRGLVHKVGTQQEAHQAKMTGGLKRVSEMDEVDWLPAEGWTAGLSGVGVGVVEARIASVEPNARPGGPRAAWDCWVYFDGGGRAHLSRLLRVAHWVKNAEGDQVWPPQEPA